MTFGEKLKQARDMAGITQDRLAQLLNTTNTTISNWEKGVSKPYADMLSELCRILDVDANWILGWSSKEIATTLTPAANRVGQLYDKADDRAREIVELTLKPFDDGTLKKGMTYRDNLEIAEEIAPRINHIMKPIVGVAAAGNPDPVVDMEPEMIIADDSPPSADVGYRLNGRSMEPRYSHMSIVWVDSDADVDIGQIGIFIVDGEITCKRLQEDENGPYLAPLNKEYEIIRIYEDTDCRSKGRVVS